MNIEQLVERGFQPQDAAFGVKIPWHEPGFSRRMLRCHLDQGHDWASRRTEMIKKQAACICRFLPPARARVLDLGCGPGLYTAALCRAGHSCLGVDFSPAAVEYAREQAELNGYAAEYRLEDLLLFEPERAFDAALMLFGELNAFERADAPRLLKTAAASLKPGGKLFLEVFGRDAVKRLATEPPHWEALESGLFSESPHLLLKQNQWDEGANRTVTRYIIIDAKSSNCTEYFSAVTAYAESDYMELFRQSGLRPISRLGAAEWPAGKDFDGKLMTFVCQSEAR